MTKKNTLTIVLLFIISATFAQPRPEKAPVDPNYKITAEELEEMQEFGIVLPPIKPDVDNWANYIPDATREFPIVYDMRETGWLTPVKSQSSGGCWAYSTMGAVESRWLMLGMGEYDLSDNNLKYCHKYIPPRSTNGNHWMASAYFARRSGPYLESEDPYPGGTSGTDDCPNDLTPSYYIHNSRYPPPQDIDFVKQTVLDWGPVWSLLYWNSNSYDPENSTFYYAGNHAVNHAGCVVGWNDTLTTQGGQGAWIVKNTWGQSWGDGGYYYLSYFDSQFLKYNGYWPEVMEYEAYTTLYQYDEIGGYWGLGFEDEVGYGLVKFEGTGQDTEITKIGTFIVSYGCGVEIKIYDDFDTSLENLLCSKDEIICELPGYYTFDLDSSIVIPAGDDFYVQIRYDSNNPDDTWPIALEDTIATYAMPEIETGKFWIGPNPDLWPTAWYALGHGTSFPYDLCIKAYSYQLSDMNGIINYANSENTPMENTWVYLKDQEGEVTNSTITNTNGEYVFSGIKSGNYTIEIVPEIDWGGVNSTDALAIALHREPQSGHPLQSIWLAAADVNGDDIVDETDETLIRERTISIIDEFPAGDLVYSQAAVLVEGNNTTLNIRVLWRGDVNASYDFNEK
jgi:C1A family cysteine protease